MTVETPKIRIRPSEIVVPASAPFDRDLLHRKETAEILTRLVGALDGPTVLAIDASWGNGKSTFVRMWAQFLRKKSFPTVEFNAWETDFSRDPFVALSTELMEGLADTNPDEDFERKLEQMKRAGKEVLKRSVPGIIRIATAGILDLSPLVEQEVGNLFASYAENRQVEYVETQNSIREFISVLQDVAASLSACHDNRPLVIFIDELDRCRPSYAIELLEVAKHFFSVDHIVFVLAVNRAELANSIQAHYGSEFDASGYLRRFIDIDFRLPDPDRQEFVNSIIAHSGLEESSQQSIGFSFDADTKLGSILLAFFGVPHLSLRRIAQAIHRLCLISSMVQYKSELDLLAIVTALILRTVNPEVYFSFFRGETTDLDVANKVFDNPEMNALRRSAEGVLFETMLILASYELRAPKLTAGELREEYNVSPLLSEYKHGTGLPQDESEKALAENVLDSVKEYDAYVLKCAKGRGNSFGTAADLLELFSNDLLEDKTG